MERRFGGVGLFLFVIILCGCGDNSNITDPRIVFGRSRLESALIDAGYRLTADPDIAFHISVKPTSNNLPENVRKPEGYRVTVQGNQIKINGFDAAGIFYGCLYLIRILEESGKLPESLDFSDCPVMDLRGTCILLMKLGKYNFPVTPEEFPFFYDKKLWLEYLDFLAENKFNYIAFWNGHPFAYFVKMEKYPEAQEGMAPGLLEKNNKMLKWLCNEGQKRNIRFMFEFYNIHTSVYYQKAHGLPDEISTPTQTLAAYTSYSIERFVNEFPEVGLYVTPGEALDLEHSAEWLNDVIFPAVLRTGKIPPVMVRAWSINLEQARKIVGHYPKLYFERKFNVEMIAGTEVDPENADWAKLTGNHVVNIHCIANLEPFRWNPPSYMQKILQSSIEAGANGLHLYPRKAWRWPYGCEHGQAELQWDRDALWFEMWGRYAWNANREPKDEKHFWLDHLTKRYGTRESADYLLRSFETGADVLPAIQRLFWLGNDNHTVVAAGAKLIQVEQAFGIPFLPLDPYTRISPYLKSLRNNKHLSFESPLSLTANIISKAETAAKEALHGANAVSRNKTEAIQLADDAKAVELIARFYDYKLKAAVEKAKFERGENTLQHWVNMINNLRLSIKVFKELTEITKRTYESLSDVPATSPERLKVCPYHWSDILPILEKELAIYEEDMKFIKDPSYMAPSLPGLAGIWYGDPGLMNAKGPDPTRTLEMDWTDQFSKRARRWSARWLGYLTVPVAGKVTFYLDSDQEVILRINKQLIFDGMGKEEEQSASLKLELGIHYPIELIYNHRDGKQAFLRIHWGLQDQNKNSIPEKNLWHSEAQKREMKRATLH